MSVYPRKGDKAFAGEPEIKFGLVMLQVTGIDKNYVLGFKLAGDTLVEDIITGEKQIFDYTLAIPACYLYRHYLELHLKWILKMASRAGFLSLDKPDQKTTEGHKLLPLWKLTKDFLTKHFDDANPDTLAATEQIITEFHTADESGTELRYWAGKDGNPNLQKMPAEFNLENLRDTITRVYMFLDPYSTQLTLYFD